MKTILNGFMMTGYSDISTMGDATLSLQTVGGTTLCTTNFTVLWVDISMRCGQDDPFSPDNGMLAHSSNPIYDRLGMQKHAGFILPSAEHNSQAVVGNIVEMIGNVHPCDFIGDVSLVRDCIDELAYTQQTNGSYRIIAYALSKSRGVEPVGNDPTPRDFRDTNPMPLGSVFDVDTPGLNIRFPELLPHGTVGIARYNFWEYAVFSGRRCSDDFGWHSRTRCVRNADDTFPDVSFESRLDNPYDNHCGVGHIEVTQ